MSMSIWLTKSPVIAGGALYARGCCSLQVCVPCELGASHSSVPCVRLSVPTLLLRRCFVNVYLVDRFPQAFDFIGQLPDMSEHF